MKRLKLIVICLLIVALAVVCLAACSGQDSPEQNIEEPTQSTSDNNTTKPVVTPPVEEDPPIEPTTITATEEGITFSHPDYDYFAYWLDDGTMTDVPGDQPIRYSLLVGSHTVIVCAYDDDGKKVALAKYEYATRNVSLSNLQVEGRTVSWTAQAFGVYVKVNDEAFAATEENSYTALSDSDVVTVRAIAGMDLENHVYYIGSSVEKSLRVIPDVKETLSTPDWTLFEGSLAWDGGLTPVFVPGAIRWTVDPHATHYEISYDGGVFGEAEEAVLSNVIGDHTIAIKAIGDGVYYSDSSVVSLSYRTLKTDLSVSLLYANMAHIDTNGIITFTLNDGQETYPYPPAIEPEEGEVGENGRELVYLHPDSVDYVAGESGDVTFRSIALASIGDDLKITNYCYSDPCTVSFVATAALAYPLSFDEDIPYGSVEVLSDGRWIPSDRKSVRDAQFDGQPSISFVVPNDGTSYRFSGEFSLESGYNEFSFYYKGDGIREVTFSFLNAEENRSLSVPLGVMPAYWSKVTLTIGEEGWISSGNIPLVTYYYTTLISEDDHEERIMEVVTGGEIPDLRAFNRFCFTLSGDGDMDVSVHSAGGFTFRHDPESEGSIAQPFFAIGREYVALEPLAGNVLNEWILLLDVGNTFTLTSTSLSRNLEIIGSYELDQEDGVLFLTDDQRGFSLRLSFSYNGARIIVDEADGPVDLCQHFTENSVFYAPAEVTCSFDEGVPGAHLLDPIWTQYNYLVRSDDWALAEESQILYGTKNNSSVVLLTASTNMTNRFGYNERGVAYGLANRLSLDLGNCDREAETIGVKVALIDQDGMRHYLMGDAASFADLALSNELISSNWMFEALEVRSVEIWLENRSALHAATLYVDNLTLTYQPEISPDSEYAAPIVHIGDVISFSHELSVSHYEYSLNGVDWIEGSYLEIPTQASEYRLSVRAYIDGVETSKAIIDFVVKNVKISAISLLIEEDIRTASWRDAEGVVSIRKDRIVNGNITEGEWEDAFSNECVISDNTLLHVRVSGTSYFDEEGGKWILYVGTQEVTRNILIDAVVLDKPVIRVTENGLTWDPVPGATGYEISINDRDYVYYTENSLPFATEVGRDYIVRVRSAIREGDSIIATSSDLVEADDRNVFEYSVRGVSLSNLTASGLTANWSAVACNIVAYMKGAEGRYIEVDAMALGNGRYSYTLIPTVQGRYYVKALAQGGFNEADNTYYYSAEDVSREVQISVSRITEPGLKVRDDGSGVAWTVENKADRYMVRIDVYDIDDDAWIEGEWREASGGTYSFPRTEGLYRLYVQGVGNGSNVLNSPIARKEFRAVRLALSDIEIAEQDETHCVAIYDYTAKNVYYSDAGENAAPVATSESRYETTETRTLNLYVEPSFDESDPDQNVYYFTDDGERITKSRRIVVPVYLAAPVLTASADDNNGVISWTGVANASEYRYTLLRKQQDGTYQKVEGAEGEKTFKKERSCAFYNEDGEYRVILRPWNEDSEQYFIREEDLPCIDYTVATVSLSDPMPDPNDKNHFVWEYVGFHLYLSTSPIRDYSLETLAAMMEPWDKNDFTNIGGEDGITLYIRAIPGFDTENNTLYVLKGSGYKTYTLDYSQLLTPHLKLNADSNGLIWDEINKAEFYKYIELIGTYTEDEIALVLADDAAWNTLAKNNRRILFDREQTGVLHTVYIKAVGGENSTITPSDIGEWTYTPYEITLSDFTVTSEGEGKRVTWEKKGITQYETVTYVQGLPENSGYQPIENTYYADRTIVLRVRCMIGYSENCYYFGQIIDDKETTSIVKEMEIVVPRRLSQPNLSLGNTGVTFPRVSNADKYYVSLYKNNLLEKSFEFADSPATLILSFSTSLSDQVGSYRVTVQAQSEEQSDRYPDSLLGEISYEVRALSLRTEDISVDPLSGRVTFGDACGLLYVKEVNGEYSSDPITKDYHQPTRTTTIQVKVGAGTDAANGIVYVGSTIELPPREVIVPIKLLQPAVTMKRNEISIARVENASGCKVRIDGGNETTYLFVEGQDDISISYSTEVENHTITIVAFSNDAEQYFDSESIVCEYRTEAVHVELSLDGRLFSWTVQAYSASRWIDKGLPTSVDFSGEYRANKSTELTIEGSSGYLDGVYYYHPDGADSKSRSITISTLSKPSLSISGTEIVWSAIADASGYEVRVNNGAYTFQNERKVSLQSSAGTYDVYVRAKGNDVNYLTSDADVYHYTVTTVTLSNITTTGTMASWTATALQMELDKGDGNGYVGIAIDPERNTYTETRAGKNTIKVRVRGGWYEAGKTYYYAPSDIVKTATFNIQKLATPVLTANNNGVSWASVANATAYVVSIDGEEREQTDRTSSFATNAGRHTVRVRAKGSATYSDSDVASFTYETKTTSLTFINEANAVEHVSWRSDAIKVQYSTDNGSTYKDTSYSGYTATKSGTVKFRAVGGWDAADNVYYSGSASVLSKTFSLPGLAIAENFETGVSGWSLEWYNTNKWETNNTISVKSVGDAYGAGSAIKLSSYLNGMAYRFGYQFGELPASYKSLSFNVKLNDYLSEGTSLRFQDSQSGTYVDYNLKNLNLECGVWYHVVIGFEDANLIINSGNKEYTAPKAKSLLGEKNFYEKIKALDRMYITVKGNHGNGVAVYTYFDNFQFSTSGQNSASHTKIASTDINFKDGTINGVYSATGWKMEMYNGSSYVTKSDALKIEDSAKVLSLYCGYTTYRVTYSPSSGFGTVNHVSMAIGAGNGNRVNYHIELIKKNGDIIYVAGGAGYNLSLTGSGSDNLTTISYNFTDAEIKSIVIYASASGDGHFYVDDLILSRLS